MFHCFSRRRKLSNVSEYYYENESVQEDTFSFESSENILQKCSRTSSLILDHKQFIAARRIQTAWRVFHFRAVIKKRSAAAVTIQRWWRGFWVRNSRMRNVEAQLQQTLLDYYDKAATRIQALYRGWHIRQTVHDTSSLKKLQVCAAEELLSCVAYKLHHLLRTYSIPGVYSTRNTHCLSQVERLLSSMTYRYHNDRVRYLFARQAYLSRSECKHFKKNVKTTEVPFPGHNYLSQCKPRCEQNLLATKDLDSRMYKIIAKYENAQLDNELHKVQRNVAQRKFQKRIDDCLARQKRHKRDFCGDVIVSMRKWKIWDKDTLSISSNILREPQNLNNFLEEASNLMNNMNANCYCTQTGIEKMIS